MDRTKIVDIVSNMKSKEDFLSLLNLIKKEWMGDVVDADYKFHSFSLRQLNFYCNPNHEALRYRQFKIKKKSGGYRLITAPRNKSFKLLLRATNEILKALYKPSPYAMGFVEGRSVVSNAIIHVGQNYVFNIDLKDFFPSVEQARVWKRLQAKPYNLPEQIAGLIAGLCAMRIKRDIVNENAKHEYDKLYQYVLPQGAPTSPILTNMVCDKLDYLLGGLAKRFGLNYTRYADDITFSSMHYVYSKNGSFITELKRIISEQGFTINDGKTRLQKKGERQEVTGLVVCKKTNVTQKYVREVRTILHIWEKYGYEEAYSSFLPKYKTEKGHVKKGNPDLINVIEGKLLYLKMVKGAEDPVYIKLNNRFQRLVYNVINSYNTNSRGTSFIKTYNLTDFENNESYSSISFEKKDDGKQYAYFTSGGKKQNVSIDKKLNSEDFSQKENLSISLCRGADEKTFWLIHKKNKVNVPPQQLVDVDKLIDDLDDLLNSP